MDNYSVLMSVYGREKPDFLSQAIASIWAQTVATDDFVLMCDGPLTDDLNAIIAEQEKDHPSSFRAVRILENKGLGNALSVGISECRNELILRADSDDISLPQRAEKELVSLQENNLDILSSPVTLFSIDPKIPTGQRKVPLSSEEIRRFAQKRSPFNHPSVLFRKSAVINAGNYSSNLRFRQDYYLWIRMIQTGAKTMNLAEPLVLMRNNENLVHRRKNKEAHACSIWIMKYMRKTKFIGFHRYILDRLAYGFQYWAPSWLLSFVYKHILHKS